VTKIRRLTHDGLQDVLLSERERLFHRAKTGPHKISRWASTASRANWVERASRVYFIYKPWVPSAAQQRAQRARYAAGPSADLSFTCSVNKNTKLTFGGNNIFNIKPSTDGRDGQRFKYDSVQFGLNGTSYFGRLWVKFDHRFRLKKQQLRGQPLFSCRSIHCCPRSIVAALDGKSLIN
jgi:iron complex outermembrane receptor protein